MAFGRDRQLQARLIPSVMVDALPGDYTPCIGSDVISSILVLQKMGKSATGDLKAYPVLFPKAVRSVGHVNDVFVDHSRLDGAGLLER